MAHMNNSSFFCNILSESSHLNVDDTILGKNEGHCKVALYTDCIIACHVGEEDTFDVKCAIVKVAARFYSLGCALGLSVSTLNKIRNDNPHDSEIALVQVINAWLAQQFDTERFGAPSWRRLVNALAEPAGGNDHLLAKKIAEDHPGKWLVNDHCLQL